MGFEDSKVTEAVIPRSDGRTETEVERLGLLADIASSMRQCNLWSSLRWCSMVEYFSGYVDRVCSWQSKLFVCHFGKTLTTISSSMQHSQLWCINLSSPELFLCSYGSSGLWIQPVFLFHLDSMWNAALTLRFIHRLKNTFFTFPASQFLKDGALHFWLW